MSFITAASLSAEANYRNFDELKALLESDADDYLFLDVRTGPEYGAGHIPGAENISYNLLPGALPEGTEKDKTIIVYCRSGNRSGTAKRLLEKAGYTNVHDFGGISRWKGDLE
ncbi:MAG: rhodanese-like domain-containing protein [Spirochaetales bacterium]|nr:rhodanese-like domain-containing protein [Spirochaetales bacterium]